MRFVLILLAILFTFSGAVSAANHGKVVVVVTSGIPLDYIAQKNLKNISRIVDTGAVAIMNSRPASSRGVTADTAIGGYSPEGSLATIGSGTRTMVTTDSRKACNALDSMDERPAQDWYESYYGKSSGKAEVLHLGMNRLIFVNKEAKYPIEPGALGTALHKASLKTAVVGNSDTFADYHREATLIASDSNGIVDYGNVGISLLKNDPLAPYGIRTNIDVLIAEYNRVLPKADLIVVDTGDCARAANYSRHCQDAQGEKLRQEALKTADRIIGEVLKKLDMSHDRLLVVSTSPSWLMMDNFDFLPPVIMAGKGISHGLIESGSTRRPGIITNADISSSILDYFGIEAPVSFVGRPVTVEKGDIDGLVKTNNLIKLQMESQPAMRGIAAFMVAFVIIISALALWKSKPGIYSVWGSWATIIPISLILATLILPGIVRSEMVETVASLIGLTLAIWLFCRLAVRSVGGSIVLICAATVAVMLVDIARGTLLLRDSIMSYTPVDGARYYGIGNEYMGVLIGAAIVLAGCLAAGLATAKRLRMVVIVVILSLVTIAIGLPSRGANAGGAMSAAAAVAAGLILWSGKKFDKKYILLVMLAVPVAFGLMTLVDRFYSGGTQSHVGRAAQLMVSGGIADFLLIAQRKLEMNLMLIRYSPWSKLLIALTVAVITIVYLPSLEVIKRLRKAKDLQSGLIAAAIGTAAALLLNDSGVVAAATAFIYVWTVVAATALAVARKDGQDN